MKAVAYLSLRASGRMAWSDRVKKHLPIPVVAGVTQSPPKSVPKGHLLIKVNLLLPDDVFDGFIPEVNISIEPSALVGVEDGITAAAEDGTDWVAV